VKPTHQWNQTWSNTTVDCLVELGVKHACISPGSRNSALTHAFTSHKKIKSFSHIDERSGGFFALGIANASQTPVVLICTSGTAVANYLPAIIEASMSRIPIIILSADRPEYLTNTGANQTIQQKHFFGYHVRWFADVGLPKNNQQSLIDLLEKSVNISTGNAQPPGPIHLNFPFEEPLLGKEIDKTTFTIKQSKKEHPKIEYPCLLKSNKALIVAGRLSNKSEFNSIIKLSEQLNAPIFADVLSQLRFNTVHPNIISNYHHFLKKQTINPDIIFRFGQKPVSKILNQKLDKWKPFTYLVDNFGHFNDDCPNVIKQSITEFTNSFQENSIIKSDQKWVDLIRNLESNVKKSIQNYDHSFYEGDIAQICVQSLTSDDQLILGNSMPIRDVDMFCDNSNNNIHTYCNRGASGIDGVVSTALGIASTNQDVHSLLLIGDLSFYHDMNGLLSAKRYGINCTIVVVNNNGGGIFSFLPHTDLHIETYPEFLTTSHGLEFEHIAKLYDCTYSKVGSKEELEYLLFDKTKCGIHIIEVIVNMENNVKTHHEISQHIQNNLK